MKLSSLPQLYRNVRRWTEIVSVLSKYGLADWISQFNLEIVNEHLKAQDGEVIARHPREARIRLALTDLGPTYIKLGQILSMRPDIVGVALADELKKLQTSVRADPPEKVREIVETELGEPLETLFIEFDLEPIASASIGQVHLARLASGEPVVVKVQHADIEQKVHEDLEVLAGVAQLAERLPEFAPYRPVATTAEMARTLRRELDFGREERNLQQFAALFYDDVRVRIPQPFGEYCTPRVLTMERIEGLKLAEGGRLVALGYDTAKIAQRGAEIYLEMIFTHGFYHADPHPGNIVILPGDVIGLIDFGMVGRLDERLREDIENMLAAIAQHDAGLLTSIIVRVGHPPPDLDEGQLSTDLADFVAHYGGQALDRFDLGGALSEMTEMLRRHRILLPAQVGMLIKTLITLEGSARLLNPQFSLMEVMLPFHRRLILKRLSPLRQVRKLRRIYYELERMAEALPRRIMSILEQVQAGKFDVHLDHRGLSPSINRLVLGMMTSALFLGSSLMLSQQVPPLLFPTNTYLGLHRLSLLGLSGCVVSILIGLRLLRAIGKSGHLDQKE